MAGSPFELFRRNQRQLLVVLTGMAMFAFIFLDAATMRSGELPKSLTIILVALVCAAGMWVVGNPRGKGNELALYGALIGGVIAFFGLRSMGPPPVAVTAIGNFNRNDLQLIAQKRSYANRFVQSASKGMDPGFGGTDDPSLVQRAVLLNEAKKRNISISKDGVDRFISQITSNRLSQGDFKGILQSLGIGAADLYQILQEELAIKLAFDMDRPPELQPIFDMYRPMSANSERTPPQTPLSYWQQYRMLQVRQALDVAAIPVEAFLPLVPEPNDAELQSFFERYKNQPPNPMTGEPGFLIDRKVNLAYLAADFEEFERNVAEPTDEEVVAYYNANKQNYRVFDLPDSPDDGLMSDDDDTPASALDPANLGEPALDPADGTPAASADATKPATPPAPSLPEPADQPKPDAEAKPEPAPKSEDEAKPEAPKTEAPKSDEDNSAAAQRSSGIPVRLASFTQDVNESEDTAKPETPAESPKPAEPTEAAKSDDQEKAADAPADPAPASDPAPTETPKLPLPPRLELPPGLDNPLLDFPPSPGSSPHMPEPRYRELDDSLKLQIRETILRERAFEAMGVAVNKAYDEMLTLADDYFGALDDVERKEQAIKLAEKMKEYAQANRLEYVETGLMSGEQLQSSVTETIGAAMEPTNSPFERGAPVMQTVFANETLYAPYRADSMLRDKRYAYWKIDDQKPRVATLAEVKDRVTAAWKLAQARPLAEKRAQELAELIQSSGKPMTEALSGQTITGKEGSQVTVRETPRFSWMSSPRNLPFQFNQQFTPPPQLSQVDGVTEPGEAFMRTVFEEIGPNQAGVALNNPKSIYYVAYVKQRDATPSDGTDNLGLKALQQQFLNDGRVGFDEGPYPYLTYPQLFELFGAWQKAYEAKHAVQWEENEADLPDDTL